MFTKPGLSGPAQKGSQDSGPSSPVGPGAEGPAPSRAASCLRQGVRAPRTHLPLPLCLGQLHLLQHLRPLLHDQCLLVGERGDVAINLEGPRAQKSANGCEMGSCYHTAPLARCLGSCPNNRFLPQWAPSPRLQKRECVRAHTCENVAPCVCVRIGARERSCG